MKLTKKNIEGLQRKYAGLQSRMKNYKVKAEETTEHIIGAAEVSGTAFGFGFISGYFRGEDGSRGIQILGVPLDLGTGIGLHLLAMLGGGKWAGHWRNAGNGALAAYLTATGAGMGSRMLADRQARGALPAPAAASGVLPDTTRHSELGAATSGAPLSADELRALATL